MQLFATAGHLYFSTSSGYLNGNEGNESIMKCIV